MKKIILVLLILLLCGCDYKELNNLGIITMIGIDYKDNKYITNIELLNINENSEEKSIILNGEGKTLEEALTKAEDNSEYIFNYSHVYSIIISDNIIKKGKNIGDFLIRNKDLRKDVLIFYSDDINSILEYKPATSKSIGESIFNIVNNSDSSFITSKYREIVHAKLNNLSYLIGNIENNSNTFNFNNYYLFIDKKRIIIEKKYAFLYGLLNKKIKSFIIDNDSYKAYDYSIKTKVKNSDISIIIKPKIKIINVNNKNIDTYKNVVKTENYINKIIKKKITNNLDFSYKNNIDINNLSNIYYLKYGKNIKLKDLNINIIIKSTINEKGLSAKGFK